MKIVYVPYGLVLLGVALTTPKPLWHPIAFFALTFVVVDTIPDFFARSFLPRAAASTWVSSSSATSSARSRSAGGGCSSGPIVVVLTVHFGGDGLPGLASDFLRE